MPARPWIAEIPTPLAAINDPLPRPKPPSVTMLGSKSALGVLKTFGKKWENNPIGLTP